MANVTGMGWHHMGWDDASPCHAMSCCCFGWHGIWVWAGIGPPEDWCKQGRGMAQHGVGTPCMPCHGLGRGIGWLLAARHGMRSDMAWHDMTRLAHLPAMHGCLLHGMACMGHDRQMCFVLTRSASIDTCHKA